MNSMLTEKADWGTVLVATVIINASRKYLSFLFSRRTEPPARLVIRLRTVSGSEFN
jgi:hypothetical protein